MLRLNQFNYIHPHSQKQPHPLIFQNYPLESPVFLVHKRHISNFIILYNTLGFYALLKFEGPYFVLIFKVYNFYIYILQFQLSSCSFLHNKGLKTKDFTILTLICIKYYATRCVAKRFQNCWNCYVFRMAAMPFLSKSF